MQRERTKSGTGHFDPGKHREGEWLHLRLFPPELSGSDAGFVPGSERAAIRPERLTSLAPSGVFAPPFSFQLAGCETGGDGSNVRCCVGAGRVKRRSTCGVNEN